MTRAPRRLRTPLALIRACHPEPTAAVTVVAGLLALAAGAAPGRIALVAATVLASQLAVGWSNDAIDADRDTAVGRTDKPIATGRLSRRTVGKAAGVAAGLTVAIALGLGPLPALLATIGLASALAYNWPLKRTAGSVLPYAVSFAALPAFVVTAAPATPPPWLVGAGALLGAGAHFANALPDLADDAATGVRGLPHRAGATGSGLAAAALLLATTGLLVAGPPGPPSWWGWAALLAAAVVLPAGWYAGWRAGRLGRRGPAMFRAFMVVALVDVGLLVAGGSVV